MKKILSFSALLLALLVPVSSFAESEAVPEGEPAVRLESIIVGDKEQPAVSYFVPWQGTRTPDRLQWQIERKHDATLSPVDRDVLERSVTVYEQMNLEKNAD